MATAAPNTQLPLLYNGLEPLNSNQHAKARVRRLDSAPQVGKTHAIPVTVDEFALVQRTFPIVFSAGENPVPLALMGLNEGVNTFMDEEGKLTEPNIYLPAYLRRYPFMLARLRPDTRRAVVVLRSDRRARLAISKTASPCSTATSRRNSTKAILQFCEQFETAGQRTGAFMTELKKSGLLMEGEVAIQPEGAEQPFVYRGFQMVDEEKFRELRGDELRKMNQNGMLALIFAHLFSLSQIREIFSRQVAQGKGPFRPRQPATAEA